MRLFLQFSSWSETISQFMLSFSLLIAEGTPVSSKRLVTILWMCQLFSTLLMLSLNLHFCCSICQDAKFYCCCIDVVKCFMHSVLETRALWGYMLYQNLSYFVQNSLSFFFFFFSLQCPE